MLQGPSMEIINTFQSHCGLVLFWLVHTFVLVTLRACLHGDESPQVGEVTRGRSPHLSCKRDEIKMRDDMDRRVTPPKQVTSPTWGPPPPCKQTLILHSDIECSSWKGKFFTSSLLSNSKWLLASELFCCGQSSLWYSVFLVISSHKNTGTKQKEMIIIMIMI